MISFYTVPMPRCNGVLGKCGKPATERVMASGNVNYGEFCKSCAPKKIKRLEAVHNKPIEKGAQR